MILVDSSAWIEFLRATGSPTDRRLTLALETGETLATSGLVELELLAGARSEQQAGELVRLLQRCEPVAVEVLDYRVAADIYRVCRRSGATLRGLVDCLIAAVAARNGVPVLHRDRDFETIARYCSLVTMAPG